MSKRYFTKYLPVKGPIKVGDITIEKLTDGRYHLWQIDTENDIDLKNQMKVEMFLCITKLSPGDTIINIHTYHEMILESNKQIENQEANWCKKIGIIPNCKVHYEFEEYDKSEVKMVWTNGIQESSSRFDLFPVENTYLIVKLKS